MNKLVPDNQSTFSNRSTTTLTMLTGIYKLNWVKPSCQVCANNLSWTFVNGSITCLVASSWYISYIPHRFVISHIRHCRGWRSRWCWFWPFWACLHWLFQQWIFLLQMINGWVCFLEPSLFSQGMRWLTCYAIIVLLDVYISE